MRWQGFWRAHHSKRTEILFYSYVVEEELPRDLVAVGVLVDNRSSEFKEADYTFFIFIDSSKKHESKTDKGPFEASKNTK